MQFKVYGNRVVFEHNRYFMRNASVAVLGAWGKKKTPIGGKNYLSVESVMGDTPKARPTYTETGPHSADFDSSFKLGHIGNMNLPFKMFNLTIDDATTYSVLREGQCVFRRRDFSPEDLRRILNNMPRFRQRLAQDNDYRFVTSVIWVESCRIDTNKIHDVDIEGDFDLGLPSDDGETIAKPKGKGTVRQPDTGSGGAGFALSLQGDDSMATTRNLSFEYGRNTVMAYGLHKIVWDHKQKKNRDRIVSLEPDWQGIE